jgi:uncharacterized protein (DUF111 family)
MVSFLCRSQELDRLADILLTETSAIGLRHYRADRIVLQRRIVEVQSEFGPVHYKQAFDSSGRLLRESAEYEDCRRIARERGVPCREVMEQLYRRGVPEA